MLPNVYGWSWTPVHVIFVSVFFLVGLTVATTVLMAWWRARRDLNAGQTDSIRWREEFHELPCSERTCRHEITGRFRQRECDRAFDCRECATHAKLLSEREPAELYYDRGHTWVRVGVDGILSVGLDDIAAKLLGPEAHLELPAAGAHVQVHAPAVRAHRNGHDVRILSPVEGEVLPSTDDGALFRVKPAESPTRLTHLLAGREAEIWKMREMERLQLLLAPEAALASLADGGLLVEDIPAIDPKADWSRVWGAMLLEP
jgi:hypothetical protein